MEARASRQIPALLRLSIVFVLLMASLLVLYAPVRIEDDEPSYHWWIVHLGGAEITFQATDADRNGLTDYWVHDIAGLYRVAPANDPLHEGLKLIPKSVALADRYPRPSPSGVSYSSKDILGTPKPRKGYWYKILPLPASMNGRHPSRFAMAAFPAKYGETGRYTYILSESNMVWRKDLGGMEVLQWPEDPPAQGWEKWN